MCGIRLRFFGFMSVFLLIFGWNTSPSQADEGVYKKTLTSVAWILSPEEKGKYSTGSGVLIDLRQGLILTAYHVVENRPEVVVFFPIRVKGELITNPDYYLKNVLTVGVVGRVIATDSIHDLALIKIPRIPNNATAIPLARESAEPGQCIFAIGNSGSSDGVLWRYIDGSVRQNFRNRMTYKSKQKVDARVVEMTLPANSGDSGGPIFNAKGELVAITAASRDDLNAVHYGIDISEISSMVRINLTDKEVAKRILGTPPGSTIVPPAASTVAAAKLTDMHIEQNVERNGKKGILMHCNIQIDHATGAPCDIVLNLFNEKRELLMKTVTGSPDKKESLKTHVCVTPIYEESVYDDVTLFVSYESIYGSYTYLGYFVTPVECCVNVWDATSKRWLLPESKSETFQFKSNLGTSTSSKMPIPE